MPGRTHETQAVTESEVIVSDEEWDEALDFLLTGLREIGADEFAGEIQAQVDTLTLFDAAEAEVSEESSKARRRELARFAVRARTPEERLRLALSMTVSRIVEFPAVESRILKWMGTHLGDIRFLPDQGLEAKESEPSGFLVPSVPYDSGPGKAQSEALHLLDLIGD